MTDMNSKKKVWQVRPTLIEHLKRCDMTLENWMKKNEITDEAKMIEVCKYLDVIAPDWNVLAAWVTMSHVVALDNCENSIIDEALKDANPCTEINIPTFETQEENAKKKRLKKIAVALEKLSSDTKETEER